MNLLLLSIPAVLFHFALSTHAEDEASTSPPTRRRSQRLSCGRRRVAVSSPSAPVRKTRNQYALAEERIRDISRGYRGELSRFRSRTRSITAAEATADQGAKSGKQPARRAVEYGLDGRPIVKKSSHSRRTSVVSHGACTIFSKASAVEAQEEYVYTYISVGAGQFTGRYFARQQLMHRTCHVWSLPLRVSFS